MRVQVKLIVDKKEIILSDRKYKSKDLDWKKIEEAKVDSVMKLNKKMRDNGLIIL